MTSHDEYVGYGPDEWEQLNEFYTAYIVYLWAILKCDTLIKTNAAKELLEIVKTVKFDVIVADITLSECFYGLWEVKIYLIIYNYILKVKVFKYNNGRVF